MKTVNTLFLFATLIAVGMASSLPSGYRRQWKATHGNQCYSVDLTRIVNSTSDGTAEICRKTGNTMGCYNYTTSGVYMLATNTNWYAIQLGESSDDDYYYDDDYFYDDDSYDDDYTDDVDDDDYSNDDDTYNDDTDDVDDDDYYNDDTTDDNYNDDTTDDTYDDTTDDDDDDYTDDDYTPTYGCVYINAVDRTGYITRSGTCMTAVPSTTYNVEVGMCHFYGRLRGSKTQEKSQPEAGKQKKRRRGSKKHSKNGKDAKRGKAARSAKHPRKVKKGSKLSHGPKKGKSNARVSS